PSGGGGLQSGREIEVATGGVDVDVSIESRQLTFRMRGRLKHWKPESKKVNGVLEAIHAYKPCPHHQGLPEPDCDPPLRRPGEIQPEGAIHPPRSGPHLAGGTFVFPMAIRPCQCIILACYARRCGMPDSSRPEIILDVDFQDGALFLSLRNIGSRPAHDVRTALEPPLCGLGGTQQLSELAIFRGIPFFAPGKEIRFLFDSRAAYFSRGQPTRFSARIRYSDGQGNEFEAVIPHDLEIYRLLAYRAR